MSIVNPSASAPTSVPGDTDLNSAIAAALARLEVWNQGAGVWQRVRDPGSADNTTLGALAAGLCLRGPGGAQFQMQTATIAGDADDGLHMGSVLPSLFTGSSHVRQRAPAVFKPVVTASGAEATIWTPTAGKKFRLMGGILGAAAAGDIILRDNTAGTIIARIPYAALGPGVHFQLGNGILSAAANNLLTASGGGVVSGTVFGTEE